LSRNDQRKIIAVTVLQISMGALDLLGIIALGLLGALSVTGLQSQNPGDRVSAVLRFLHLQDATFQTQASIIGISAVALLIGRTVLSIFFTRRVLHFLSRRGALISSNLISQLLSQPLLKIQMRTTQETLFAVTNGVEIIVLQIMGTSMVLISDISLLIVMGIGLVKNHPVAGKYAVHSVNNYNRFVYIGKWRIDREDMSEDENSSRPQRSGICIETSPIGDHTQFCSGRVFPVWGSDFL
jgi:hypothetical protein